MSFDMPTLPKDQIVFSGPVEVSLVGHSMASSLGAAADVERGTAVSPVQLAALTESSSRSI